MSFIPVLEALCQRVPGARGAVFVDHDGECIQQHVLDPALLAYDLMVAGAHVAPIMAHVLKPTLVVLDGREGVTAIQIVTERYAVLLLTVPNVHRFQITRALAQAATELHALM